MLWAQVIFFAFLVASASLGRATRLVVDDSILDRARFWWRSNRHLPGWVVKGLGCPWCVSGWLAVPIIGICAAVRHERSVWLWWPAVWWGGIACYFVTEALARYSTESKK